MAQLVRIIKARWIIPVVPKGVVLEHHAIVVRGNVIVEIAPQQRLTDILEYDEIVELGCHVLIPGMINLHTHAAMNLLRGYADDLALMDWLTKFIWPAEERWLSSDYVYDGSLLACAEMLKGGVTTFNDMYFYPQNTIDVATQIGMRAHIGLVVMDVATHYARNVQECITLGTEVRDKNKHNPKVHFSFAPHAPYTVSDNALSQIVTLAAQLELGIHTHLHETEAEITQSVERYGVRPIARLDALGVLGPNSVLAHCVHLQPKEFDVLAKVGAHIAHCPSSNLKLASGIASIHSAMDKGINVGLGTDSASSNNRLDMWQEMHLAALLAKAESSNPAAVDAITALEMATINGAKALGLDASIGSLEVGKQADIVAVAVDDLDCLPMYDLTSHLVYVAAREHVSHVWVAGELVYQKATTKIDDPEYQPFKHITREQLLTVAKQWQLKLGTFKQQNHPRSSQHA